MERGAQKSLERDCGRVAGSGNHQNQWIGYKRESDLGYPVCGRKYDGKSCCERLSRCMRPELMY